jgi:hypothetical protein
MAASMNMYMMMKEEEIEFCKQIEVYQPKNVGFFGPLLIISIFDFFSHFVNFFALSVFGQHLLLLSLMCPLKTIIYAKRCW